VVWKRQFTADDVWTVFEPPGGKDYDIGAAPNLRRDRSTSHSETGPVVSQRTARPRSQRLAIRCHSA
jgi:hypothetical protein